MAADTQGNVYTANSGKKPRQFFAKWDRTDGRHVFVRVPASCANRSTSYAIAVDDKYIYCTTYTYRPPAQQHDATVPPQPTENTHHFPAPRRDGNILIQTARKTKSPRTTAWTRRPLKRHGARSRLVAKSVTDALDGRVLSFDESGAPLGAFGVTFLYPSRPTRPKQPLGGT